MIFIIGPDSARLLQCWLFGRSGGRAGSLLWLVAGLIRAVVGSRELEGPGWRLAVERPVTRAERLGSLDDGDEWSAVLEVRRGLKLLVSGDSELPDPLIEAWAGEPGYSSDGVAVVDLAGAGLAVTRVPLCGCGDRGCGNSGIQLCKQVAAGDLLAVLRALPWTSVVQTRSNVARANSLAAFPVPRGGGPSKIVYHGARTQDGVLAAVRRVLRDRSGRRGRRPRQAEDS